MAMKRTVTYIATALVVISAGVLSGCVADKAETQAARGPGPTAEISLHYDQELARLLVRLELRTRAVIAKHYAQADPAHRAWLAENLLLPAAVADAVFHEVLPDMTNGRAWVKMVVDHPRNPHNAGDVTAIALFHEVRGKKPYAERSTREAYYYAEPIKAAKTCLLCHGDPKGGADPFFPQYKKNGWQEGEIVGAVVARVAPAG
jgi:hypothetical protein